MPDEFIVSRIAADHQAGELGEGFEDPFAVNDSVMECFFETLDIFGIMLQFLNDTFQIFVHLERVRDGREGLHVEMVDASIPHKTFLPNHVLNGGDIALTYQAIDAMTDLVINMCECRKPLMTEGTANRVILGKKGIIKQIPAQQKAIGRDFIILEFID